MSSPARARVSVSCVDVRLITCVPPASCQPPQVAVSLARSSPSCTGWTDLGTRGVRGERYGGGVLSSRPLRVVCRAAIRTRLLHTPSDAAATQIEASVAVKGAVTSGPCSPRKYINWDRRVEPVRVVDLHRLAGTI